MHDLDYMSLIKRTVKDQSIGGEKPRTGEHKNKIWDRMEMHPHDGLNES